MKKIKMMMIVALSTIVISVNSTLSLEDVKALLNASPQSGGETAGPTDYQYLKNEVIQDANRRVQKINDDRDYLLKKLDTLIASSKR